MSTITKIISKAKAEQSLRKVRKDFAWYLDGQPEVNNPYLVERYGHPVIFWESGPDDWAYDYSFKFEVPGVSAEPYTAYALGLYLP